VLNEDVLPNFEAYAARVTKVLSDNGREYCGRPDGHPYVLFQQLEGTEHRTQKARRLPSKGFVERLRRTLLGEHSPIKGHQEWYESLKEIQIDLDGYLRQ